MERDKLFERVRAAKLYTTRTPLNAKRQAELEMAAFLDIFHPELTPEQKRELIREAE